MAIYSTMLKTNENLRRKHALHNEDACYYLYEAGKFPDWVITTAFYSALQFVKYKAFPLKGEFDTYPTFEDYFALQKNRDDFAGSRHDVIKKLVQHHLRPIAAYQELFDACHNARYSDYQLRNQDVELALDNLSEIKKFCNTEKPKKKKRPRLPRK